METATSRERQRAQAIAEEYRRRGYEEEGLVLEGFNPLSILTQATSNGVISRDDYSFLAKVMKYRNAVAHGFKAVDFDSVLVTELINVTKRMLQSTSVP